jgi:molecular chaperone DnaJ
MISDPYRVLGVSPSDSSEDIARAYRRLAKKYHPDLNHGSEAAAKRMSEINAAYEQIKSRNAVPGGGAGSQEGYDRYDPFEGFDPFGTYGPYGDSRRRAGQTGQADFQTVESFLRAGYYAQAANVLSGIHDRSAQWYYTARLPTRAWAT